MSDLVERLRATGFDRDNLPRMKQERWLPVGLAQEAADEIEHLNGIIKTAMGGKRAFEDRIALIKEIERLRAALEYYASGIAGRGDIARKALEDKP